MAGTPAVEFETTTRAISIPRPLWPVRLACGPLSRTAVGSRFIRQLQPQRLGDAIGEIGDADGHGQLDDLAVAQLLLEPVIRRHRSTLMCRVTSSA